MPFTSRGIMSIQRSSKRVVVLRTADLSSFSPEGHAHLIRVSDPVAHPMEVCPTAWSSVYSLACVDGDYTEDMIRYFRSDFDWIFQDYFAPDAAYSLLKHLQSLVASGAETIVVCDPRAGRRANAIAAYLANVHDFQFDDEDHLEFNQLNPTMYQLLAGQNKQLSLAYMLYTSNDEAFIGANEKYVLHQACR